MVKTNNGISPRREQAIMSNLIDRLSREFIIKIGREIVRAMDEGAKLYEQGLPVDIMLNKHEKNIDKILNNLWNESRDATLQILSRKKDAFIGIASDYAQKFGADKVKDITTTTARHTKDAIQKAVEEGLGIDKTAKLIRHHARGIRTTRAKTIARTEIAQASAYANTEKARQESEELGIIYDKQWISADDERVREAHIEAGKGEPISMNENFIVGGEELAYANDPAGSPENVINCRCATAYIARV